MAPAPERLPTTRRIPPPEPGPECPQQPVSPIPPLAIPNKPIVIGVHFFDQAYLIDRKANALGIAPTFSNEWAIGSGLVPSVGEIFRWNDSPPKKNGWRFFEPQAPVIQFGY